MAMNKVFLILLLFVFSLCVTAQKKENKDGLASDSIYTVVEQMPSFPGGEAEMLKYIGTKVKYPYDAENLGLQGRIVIDGYIDIDGSIKNLSIRKGLHPSVDSAYYKVIRRMPKWEVGKHNGKPVKVYQRFQFLPHFK